MGALTLGAVSGKVVRSRRSIFGTLSKGYRETHLANPLRCPSCGRKFYVFVGVEVESDSLRPSTFRSVHVDIAREDDHEARSLARWPHKGIVMKRVIEYTPGSIYVYDSLKHFIEYNRNKGDGLEDIAASSVSIDLGPEDTGPEATAGGAGQGLIAGGARSD